MIGTGNGEDQVRTYTRSDGSAGSEEPWTWDMGRELGMNMERRGAGHGPDGRGWAKAWHGERTEEASRFGRFLKVRP